jgi:hypothetical protein
VPPKTASGALSGRAARTDASLDKPDVEPAERASLEVAMREMLGRHLDVVVVIWALTLAIGWSYVSLSRASLPADQWSSPPQNGPAWVIPSADPGQ